MSILVFSTRPTCKQRNSCSFEGGEKEVREELSGTAVKLAGLFITACFIALGNHLLLLSHAAICRDLGNGRIQ